MARPRSRPAPKQAEAYTHDEEALLRPDVGTQAQFKKKKPPRTYRYDSSLSPALDWDGQNPARELGEWLLAQIEEASRGGRERVARLRRRLAPPRFRGRDVRSRRGRARRCVPARWC